MRCTQLIGLHPEALKYLKQNQAYNETSQPCPHCGGPINVRQVLVERDYASAADVGMFNDGPELTEYTLKDGSILREIVQADPWSSGPCIFLCLEDVEGKRMFEWSEKEINDNA